MPTNFAVDDRLIVKAQRVGRHRTKKEAVTVALEQYIARREQLRILEVFGSIDYDPAHHYKRERRRKAS